MKTRILSLLALLPIYSFSQNNAVSATDNNSSAYLELFLIPVSSGIKNENVFNDGYKSSNRVITLGGGLNRTKFFSKYFGYTIGLQFSQYQEGVKMKGLYQSEDLKKDVNGDNYYLMMDCDVTEKRVLSYLSIPLFLSIRTGNQDKFGLYLDAGIRNEITLSGKFTESGQIVTMGKYPFLYYPDDYVLSYNWAANGFQTTPHNHKDDYVAKKYNMLIMVGGGVVAPINDKLSFKVGGTYSFGFMDVTTGIDKNKEYTNIFGLASAYKKTTVNSYGLLFSLRIKMGVN